MFEIKDGKKRFIEKQEFVNKIINLNRVNKENKEKQVFFKNADCNERLFNSIAMENEDVLELENNNSFALEMEAFNEQQKTYGWA